MLFFLLSGSLYAQDPPQYGTPFAGVPDPRDVNMYQALRVSSARMENFQGVISRLDQIRALGINTMYLMPHYPTGTDSRIRFTFIALKISKGVGAEYGTLTDLRQLVDGAHARGMAVILDFVVNQHRSRIIHGSHNIPIGISVMVPASSHCFQMKAALDMNNTAMRAAMIDNMRYWVLQQNVDGFRCDFANNAPVSFWSARISNPEWITHTNC